MAEPLTEGEKTDFVLHIHEDEPVVDPWDREIATSLGQDEGIELTDEHWDVVSFLRKHYDATGALDYARDVSAVLSQRFKDQGGLKYLYRLFPRGPVTQASRIAGIPVPKDSTDASFGTSA